MFKKKKLERKTRLFVLSIYSYLFLLLKYFNICIKKFSMNMTNGVSQHHQVASDAR